MVDLALGNYEAEKTCRKMISGRLGSGMRDVLPDKCILVFLLSYFSCLLVFSDFIFIFIYLENSINNIDESVSK